MSWQARFGRRGKSAAPTTAPNAYGTSLYSSTGAFVKVELRVNLSGERGSPGDGQSQRLVTGNLQRWRVLAVAERMANKVRRSTDRTRRYHLLTLPGPPHRFAWVATHRDL